jgi:anti-sigma factor RsiW
MNPMNDWQPDPQLLAAYFDGELSGADQRARIEAWLVTHPEAAEEWADLKKLLRDTTPAEPSEAAWQQVRERIEFQRSVPALRRHWHTVGLVAASVLILISLGVGVWRSIRPGEQQAIQVSPPPSSIDDIGVLQVASAEDVTITRFEGDDNNAIVVGTFPISGPLELADSGEVCIECRCPRINVRQYPGYHPMVSARAD